jgi:hypothetical protein
MGNLSSNGSYNYCTVVSTHYLETKLSNSYLLCRVEIYPTGTRL